MDRHMLIERLAQAERHVALGAQHIKGQRKIVAKLERDGHDTTQARRLLANFEDMQPTHIAYRDRLQKQLSEAPS